MAEQNKPIRNLGSIITVVIFIVGIAGAWFVMHSEKLENHEKRITALEVIVPRIETSANRIEATVNKLVLMLGRGNRHDGE